jgi:hypothetical protein
VPWAYGVDDLLQQGQGLSVATLDAYRAALKTNNTLIVPVNFQVGNHPGGFLRLIPMPVWPNQ